MATPRLWPARAHPAALLRPMLVVVALLALLAKSSHGSNTSGHFMHQAPFPLSTSTGLVGIYTPAGQLSQVAVFPNENSYHYRTQDDSMTDFEDYRLGSFFHKSSTPKQRVGYTPGDLVRIVIAEVPGSSDPAVVMFFTTSATLFQGTYRLSFPDSARIQAVQAQTMDQVYLMGATPDTSAPGYSEPYLALMNPTYPTILDTTLPMLREPVSISPGTGRGFYLSSERALYHVVHAGPLDTDPVTYTTQSRPEAILYMITTRLLSRKADCPGSLDMVLLLANGDVEVFSCYDPAGANTPTVVFRLPEGEPTNGILLAPQAASLQEPTQSLFYLVQGAPGTPSVAWKLIHLNGSLTWEKHRLDQVDVSKVELALLRMGPSGADARWMLTHQHHVLLDQASFGCTTDRTIRCADASRASLDASGSWQCADGHVLSPLVSESHLCAGCDNGMYLDRPDGLAPFESTTHACKPCPQENCATCNADHCLVCKAGHVPEYHDISGPMACVAQCSEGYSLSASVCLPTNAPRSGVAFKEFKTLGYKPGPGVPGIVGFYRSRLGVNPATHLATIPAADGSTPPPDNVLLLRNNNIPFLVEANQVHTITTTEPDHVALLHGSAFGPDEHVVHMAEVGPFTVGSTLRMGLLMRLNTGALFHGWLACPAPGPCDVAGPLSPTNMQMAIRQGFTHLPDGRVSARGPGSSTVIFTPDPANQAFHVQTYPDVEILVSLAETPGHPARSTPAAGEWAVIQRNTGELSLWPTGLDLQDSRVATLAGKLAQRDPAVNAQVTLMPRGGGRQPELVVSLVEDRAWTAFRMPRDMVSGGRTTLLPVQEQRLLYPMPNPIGMVNDLTMRAQALPFPEGGLEYPSILLMMSAEMVALAVLHCPQDDGPCKLKLGSSLSRGMATNPSLRSWDSVELLDPAGPRELARVLAFEEAGGLMIMAVGDNCLAGSYPRGFECEACDPTCATCDAAGPGNCTKCKTWMPDQPNVCLATCPAGWFSDTPGYACATCHRDCPTCKGSSSVECTSCHPGLFLNTTGACRETCNGSTLKCEAEGRCAPCSNGCVQCVFSSSLSPAGLAGATAAGPCDTTCIKCKPKVLLSEEGLCLDSCNPKCDACAGHVDFCSSCANYAFILPESGDCVASCPAGRPQFGIDRVCLQCVDNCAACTAPGTESGCVRRPDGAWNCPTVPTCDRCASSHLLLEGTSCVAACPAKYFADQAAGLCRRCHADCDASCTGPGADDSPTSGSGSSPTSGSNSSHASGSKDTSGRNKKLALGLGLGLGLPVLIILLVLLGMWIIARKQTPQKGGPVEMDVIS
ncbi:hypothetical protein H696_05432 [Fonticula alba]|uniref:Mid2 domain-containing protein n=1 Tax=Fonticula alba TaxID=691883 RepID=A0A058Z152_FONAL|nr:hypothetical protein H696_05432 [Fonticula alba]KCV67974.1 hypothetical protein H696_05432 [Fonticula alba]|eukprot:XP_009497541.1 hypothetical protein H696_05432 [Fonticula alba]